MSIALLVELNRLKELTADQGRLISDQSKAIEALAARVETLEQAAPKQPLSLKPRAEGRAANGG